MLFQGSLFTSNHATPIICCAMCTHCHWGLLYNCWHLFYPHFMLWDFVHFSYCGIWSCGILSGYHPASIRQTKPNRWSKMLAQQQQLPMLICSWNNFDPTLTAYHNNKFKQFCANHEPTLHQPKTNSVPTPGGLSIKKYNMDFLDNSWHFPDFFYF